MESGSYQRLWIRLRHRGNIDGSSTRALGYAEVFTAFVLLAAGATVAIVVAALEMTGRGKTNLNTEMGTNTC